MKWIVAAAIALGACVHSDSITCTDGSLCPLGTTCEQYASFDPAQPLHLCVPDEQVQHCAGKQEGDACPEGKCYSGACRPAGCGNRIADPGEVCDDGNRAPRDGCSSDCTSNETCGNGIVDRDVGEDCDDGNTLARDGCTSTCRAELATWTPVPEFPITRTGTRLAYDSARDVIVMWGGAPISGSPARELYEFDGTAWSLRTTGGPHPRIQPALAYDPTRGVTVLYGDRITHDTWEWDGVAWTERTPPVDPGPRAGAAMAWDPALHALVLYGGVDATSAQLADTWSYDGTTWTPRATALPDGTPPLADPQLAYDAARDVLVLAGIVSDAQTGTQHRVVCELGADATWRAIATSHVPNGTAGSFAWDPVARRTLLTSSAANQVWHTWDGTTWTDIAAAQTFGGEALLASRTRRGALVAFLGQQFYVHADAADSWTLPTLLGQLPDQRDGAAAAYDPVRRRVLWIGGSGHQQEVWTWSGTWTAFSNTPAGATFEQSAAAYDAVRERFVVFGGVSTAVDTWTVDAATLTDWRHEAPTMSPPARVRSTMVFDAARGDVVLFGGTAGSATFLADTWTWDGTTWTPRAVGGAAPSARDAAMAYDPIRARTVLWGSDSGLLVDTWEWDGEAWTQMAPASSPEPQRAHLAWDAGRRRVVLVGESNLLDAWDYDGTTWREIELANAVAHLMSFYTLEPDPSGAGVVVLDALSGGFGVTARLREEGAREEVCLAGTDFDDDGLAGCADPDCTPVCAPACNAIDASCAGARCGDGTCDATFESSLTCPADCPATFCGDFICDAGEATTCPGDCH